MDLKEKVHTYIAYVGHNWEIINGQFGPLTHFHYSLFRSFHFWVKKAWIWFGIIPCHHQYLFHSDTCHFSFSYITLLLPTYFSIWKNIHCIYYAFKMWHHFWNADDFIVTYTHTLRVMQSGDSMIFSFLFSYFSSLTDLVVTCIPFMVAIWTCLWLCSITGFISWNNCVVYFAYKWQ